MKTKKMKKWGRRILLGLLISLTVSIVAPTFMGDFVDTSNHTVYAATCKDTGETATECTPSAPGKCPAGYTEDKTKNTCTKQTTVAKTDEGTLKVMKFLIKIQDILNRAIWPVLIMIGGLMDNSLLFGNGMEERLREIWIPIRNIVNILFVIALVAIALYNVLGIGDENSNYSIKAILPKIIIGIIVVNFSFLGIKVFLDGINVLTTAIFALPNQVGQGIALDPNNPNDQELIQKACRSIEGIDYTSVIDKDKFTKDKSLEIFKDQAKKYDLDITGATTPEQIGKIAGDKLTAAQLDSWVAEYDEKIKSILCEATIVTSVDKNDNNKTTTTTTMKFTPRGELFMKRWNSRNAALAMAIGLSKIVLYKEIDINSLENIDKLVINTAMSLILYLLFAASFIALFVVLLGRLVVMWLAIVLSPILLLAMVIPAVKENISSFGDITNTFVQNAIAPLGIGLSLSIGWIMLKALQGLNSLYGGEQISFTAAQGIPVVGLTTLQDLLVGVGTIAVIWLGVFTAASKSIAAPVTDWMKGSLASAGKWVGTLPLKHAPIFKIDLPGPDDDKDNTYTGSQVLNALQSITQPNNEYKLSDALRGKRGTYAISGLKDVKKPDDVYGWLKSNKNTDSERLKDNLTEFKSKNRGLYRKLHATVQRDIDALIASKDKDKYRSLRDKVMSHSLIQKSTAKPSAETPGTPTPPGAPATPAKKHSAQQPAVNVTNKTTVINNRNELTGLLDKNANKGVIEPVLQKFLGSLPANTTIAQLQKDYLRPDTYKALVGKVGETFIQQKLPK